jgi:hypothetical protein
VFCINLILFFFGDPKMKKRWHNLQRTYQAKARGLWTS